MDLTKVADRDRLKPQREPYWQRLRAGAFLGYRAGPGTWIARGYDEVTRGYKLRALGDFGAMPPRDRFSLAKAEAEAFVALIENGGATRPHIVTVGDACREWAKAHPEAEGRFKRYVYADPIATMKLVKLRRTHTGDWRRRLAEKPAQVTRRKKGDQITRPRSPATLNRDMAALRAALGRFLAVGAPNTEAAWQEALKPIKNAVKRRTLYLSRDQRKALLEAACDQVGPFLRAMCVLPLRPGAVAGLTTGDFDKRTRELTVPTDKAGAGRRIVIPTAAVALFADATKDKLPAAPLFTTVSGEGKAVAWTKETWKTPIAEAAKAAKLPAGTTAYTLRHSLITDMIADRVPILTVAQMAGTSVAMIEAHYGHLDRELAEQALARLAI